MKLEDQVCALEQAKRLKELGIKQEGYFSWWNHGGDVYSIVFDDEGDYSALTVAELGVMLPMEIEHNYNTWSSYYIRMEYGLDPKTEKKLPVVYYEDNDLFGEQEILDMQFISARTEAEARAAMLIYLLENKLITAEEVNNRLNVKAVSHKEVG